MKIQDIDIDKKWTLFLDRDGVINQKLEADYVKNLDEFTFLPGVLESLAELRQQFGRMVLVTNQQGIGKGIMSHADLKIVHDHMQAELDQVGAKLDAIYYCPELAEKNASCRKPNTGMAISAKKDFPEIDFEKSIIVGDSISDLKMGKRAGMYTIYINDEHDSEWADFRFSSLQDFQQALSEK